MNIININGVEYCTSTGNITVSRNGFTINGTTVAATGILEVKVIEGVINNLISQASVSCTTVNGDVKADGSVKCDDVGGNVKAGGSVKCGSVGGKVKAGGSITHS